MSQALAASCYLLPVGVVQWDGERNTTSEIGGSPTSILLAMDSRYRRRVLWSTDAFRVLSTRLFLTMPCVVPSGFAHLSAGIAPLQHPDPQSSRLHFDTPISVLRGGRAARRIGQVLG